MKRRTLILIIGMLCTCVNNALKAQITIMNENVQENIISKPQTFDSLSNLTYHDNPVQYKKYIGYKLYCLPFSNKNKNVQSNDPLWAPFDKFKYKAPQNVVISRKQSITTDIYHATLNNSLSASTADIERRPEKYMYTPSEFIQNKYFTILNIEAAASTNEFDSLDKWTKKHERCFELRFTLRNETTNEEFYWIAKNNAVSSSNRDLSEIMFLVPYFEKMQKMYKGKNVVSTTTLSNLVDISTGESVNIQSSEVWLCYDVTFVNLEDKKVIQPYFLLEKDNHKIMVSFQNFTKESYNSIFSSEDIRYRHTFILEQDFNEIVAERERAKEERQKLEEERKQAEELARQERNKQIMQKYGNKFGKLICEGKVCLNMTKDMCKVAWGEPLSINSTIVKGKTFEQWVYGWQTYLYFDNGVLTAIQN